MSDHQYSYQGRIVAAQGLSSSSLHGAANASASGDDDLVSEADEPPESTVQFTKVVTPCFDPQHNFGHAPSSRHAQDRKESLLTQALLSSPELNPTSDFEAPVLTSDGGLTSPARTLTPSPPTPTTNYTGLDKSVTDRRPETSTERQTPAVQVSPSRPIYQSQETNVEAGLGRKRCITFACGRQTNSQRASDPQVKKANPPETSVELSDPPKRSCLLRFACPMKPTRNESQDSKKNTMGGTSTTSVRQNSVPVNIKKGDVATEQRSRERQDSNTTIKDSQRPSFSPPVVASFTRNNKVFNRVDFQKSEATRFHEFAGPFNTDDEWTNEQTAYRQKITVNDTLRKENAIRKLAEEAEEEALDEEAEGDGIDLDHEEDSSVDDIDIRDEHVPDDGNESDDEEGFADSDEEGDSGSEYQFWTPGLTTAATSTDHLEHIRPMSQRVASDSSIEGTIHAHKNGLAQSLKNSRVKSPRLRPSTRELPDSSDFVVGTIDEDRPLEEAYASCLEERRRSRHKLIPQDIDPSFPTSDPEPEDDDEDEDEVDDGVDWVTGRPESSMEEESLPTGQNLPPTLAKRPSIYSPKQMHSPPPRRLQSPPPKRSNVNRSPPPRRLFGHTTHRMRFPPPTHRKLTSPPSSRRPSASSSPQRVSNGIDLPHLAERPNLTHTTSLPRTPNPFWLHYRRARCRDLETPSTGVSPKDVGQMRGQSHSRGPIDIVQGLETRRQRRKEKFWRQHCRMSKDRGRRCHPGQGAERMKEVGRQMADRFRDYGPKAQLVLSV